MMLQVLKDQRYSFIFTIILLFHVLLFHVVQEIAKGELVADALISFAESQPGSLGNILKTAGIAQRKMDFELLQV